MISPLKTCLTLAQDSLAQELVVNAIIGAGCHLMAGSYIGKGSELGADCLLHPSVTLYHDVILGDRVNIHSSTVVGSDGFGFAPQPGVWNKIHQLGGVRIGSDVEIGSNTSIDRGAIDHTVVGSNVIIDNLVHIAHNVEIGDGTAIAGCVGIAGSTRIGKGCIIAGAVSINGHITIADGTQLNGGSVITKATEAGKAYASAAPMQEVGAWRRNSIRYTKLDEMHKRLVALEKLNK